MVGLLGAAVLPATIAVAELTDVLRLIEAAWAIPAAFVLGLLAVVLARRGRRRAARTVARTGARSARVGRFLGWLAVALAVSGAIAVAFFEYLDYVGA
ncbi:MAG: hypothetical protein ACM33B_03355 [Pseudomonadota bacterium]